MQNQKLKIFQAMRHLKADDIVRGQYEGYRQEAHVAKNSDVETFCALRLFIDSWRWGGVPWYLRAGKYLPATETGVVVEFKIPPQKLFADSEAVTKSSNYLRFQLAPGSTIALAARVKLAGSDTLGVQREFCLCDEQPGGETPYERLLGDAMKGDRTLFTREDTVEVVWAVVDPVIKHHNRIHPYKQLTWGPRKADALIAADGQWDSPTPLRTAE
jgi:glucose-6-phosphate 1-dehydrogenase